MNPLSELINLGFLVIILVAGYFHVLPQNTVEMLAGGLVAARLALLKPPGGGDGGAPSKPGIGPAIAGSAVGAVVLGLVALFSTRAQA